MLSCTGSRLVKSRHLSSSPKSSRSYLKKLRCLRQKKREVKYFVPMLESIKKPKDHPEVTSFGDLHPKRKMITMIDVILAMLLAALDQTIVGTALPRIVRELGGADH